VLEDIGVNGASRSASTVAEWVRFLGWVVVFDIMMRRDIGLIKQERVRRFWCMSFNRGIWYSEYDE